MEIIVPGKPIAKKRPKFVRTATGGRAYNDQETEEGKFLLMCLESIDEKLDGPLRMACSFVFERPKSHFGTGKNAGVLKESSPEYHLKVPDVDNLLKFVCDSLNNIAYKDDCQIIKKYGSKRYALEDEEAHTFIKIERVIT